MNPKRTSNGSRCLLSRVSLQFRITLSTRWLYSLQWLYSQDWELRNVAVHLIVISSIFKKLWPILYVEIGTHVMYK